MAGNGQLNASAELFHWKDAVNIFQKKRSTRQVRLGVTTCNAYVHALCMKYSCQSKMTKLAKMRKNSRLISDKFTV